MSQRVKDNYYSLDDFFVVCGRFNKISLVHGKVAAARPIFQSEENFSNRAAAKLSPIFPSSKIDPYLVP